MNRNRAASIVLMANQVNDTIAPTVTTVEVQTGLTVDVTFSEAMGTGVTTASNYTVSGTGKGTLANNPNSVALVSGNKYRCTWTTGEMFNGGNITIAVANAQDAAGNAVNSSGTHTGGAIGTAPTCTIACAQSPGPTAVTPLQMTFTLSEVSTDFAIGDITITAGTASNFAGSGASYTCDVTPDNTAPVTVSVAANAFHDAAGNGNAAATPLSIGVIVTLTLQPDGTAGIDNQIRSDNPTTNYGTNENLAVGQTGGVTARTLIKFDLSSIPTGAPIISATLSLFASADNSTNARTFRVYRQKRAWHETQSTYNIYSTGNNWQTAGGFGANDCEQTDIGSRAFSATETLSEFKDFTLVASVKEDLDLGNGWMIKADTENSDQYGFYSSDRATASQRPKLVIQYALNP